MMPFHLKIPLKIAESIGERMKVNIGKRQNSARLENWAFQTAFL